MRGADKMRPKLNKAPAKNTLDLNDSLAYWIFIMIFVLTAIILGWLLFDFMVEYLGYCSGLSCDPCSAQYGNYTGGYCPDYSFYHEECIKNCTEFNKLGKGWCYC
jgi:hypothetical protein